MPRTTYACTFGVAGRQGEPYAAVLLLLLLSACGGGGNGGGDNTISPPVAAQSDLDDELRLVVAGLGGLTGDPAAKRDARQQTPEEDALVKLGQLLFFSQTLAAGYDVSCGTCHHPALGGSDGLSLGVGVVPIDAAVAGPGRTIDPNRDLDPAADGGPNMHRNSQTVFNAALFDRALLHDGRVFVIDAATQAGGRGQLIHTPESGQRSDPDAVSGLLEFQAKSPLVNDNEMRGFFYTEYSTADEYRAHLIGRLRGTFDTEYNPNPDGPANWLSRFQLAFDAPDAAPDEVITMTNVQRALGAFVASQIFVDTPWRSYLAGDRGAISDEAKRGALLFLKPAGEGGFGCVQCHTGERFTDEEFHNVGFPQLGRGFVRADKSDLGRWLTTLDDADLSAFRTPSLVNVALTAPYGHAGSFDTLADAIAYHADPRRAVDEFDFSLAGLAQFRDSRPDYQHAEPHTRAALAATSFDSAESRLPGRPLLAHELARLVAFLEALSDRCVTTPDCIDQWVPAASDDPDGHLFVRDQSSGTPGNLDVTSPADYPTEIALTFPLAPVLTTFADVETCTNSLAGSDNTGADQFTRQPASASGLSDTHGFLPETWFEYSPTFEITMIAGGVSAAYLDDDCWPDLIFAAGDSGIKTYRNLEGAAFEAMSMLPSNAALRYTGAAIADLNGDYRRELVLGNFRIGDARIYAQDGNGAYVEVAALPMTRTSFGISFAPLDATGYPYAYFAHWSGNGTAGTAPALWKNDGLALRPWDGPAGTSSNVLDQRFNFTPSFADFTGDGLSDLVIASDFSTSATLRNAGSTAGGPVFAVETDRAVISDENGMGSALLDIDNDGNLEWFVTSVYDTNQPVGNWGASGNRLYTNTSTAERISFADITEEAGVRDGDWGWAACSADFDNDGFIDLFHVNGFGYIPYAGGQNGDPQAQYDALTKDAFQAKSSRLFINNGDGTFADQAKAWEIDDPSEGRGVVCFDMERDGDIDIVLLDHSTGLQYFRNRSGSGAGRRFLNIHVVGRPPNTEALGTRVYLTADLGAPFGRQTQLRLAQANSNFNSQNTPDLHFGLAAAIQVDTLRVVWPDGSEFECENVQTNQFIVLDERAPTCP